MNEQFRGKGKSAHDLTNDPRLSSETAKVNEDEAKLARDQFEDKLQKEQIDRERERKEIEERLRQSKFKESDLNKIKEEAKEVKKAIAKTKLMEQERIATQKREEENRLEKKQKEEQHKEDVEKWSEENKDASQIDILENPDKFSLVVSSYKKKTKKEKKHREANTLDLLSKFKSKMFTAIGNKDPEKSTEKFDWMKTLLSAEDTDPGKTRVIDPSIEHPDRYDLYDPRNPLNVRKRANAAGGQPPSKKR